MTETAFQVTEAISGSMLLVGCIIFCNTIILRAVTNTTMITRDISNYKVASPNKFQDIRISVSEYN